jgi:hypothetical protein
MRLLWRLLTVTTAWTIIPLAAVQAPADPRPYGAHMSRILGTSAPEGYTIAVIQPGFWSEMPGVRELAELAFDWDIQQYRLRYPGVDAEFFTHMRRADTPLDGHSLFVVVYKGTDPHQIQGTLRFTWVQDARQRFPFERTLRWRYPRPHPFVGPYRQFIPFGSHATLESGKLRTYAEPRVQGNLVEIKNFVTAPGAVDDLVPLMFNWADTYLGWTMQNSRRFHPLIPDPAHPNVGHFDMEHVREDLDLERASFHEAAPSEYLIMCDERMLPYYERLGFRRVRPGPIRGKNYLLRTDRDGFVGIAEKFWRRPGHRILADIHMGEVDSAAVEALAQDRAQPPACGLRAWMRRMLPVH